MPERRLYIYQALCSCGYAGAPYTTKTSACEDADDHAIAMSHIDEPEESHRTEVVSGPAR